MPTDTTLLPVMCISVLLMAHAAGQELALTDLPGLTENAREGEPEDLPKQIEGA